MKNEINIPSYIVNMERRVDRKKHIMNEFADYYQFHIHIIKAIEHARGVVGFWKTLIHILKFEINKNSPYTLVVQDDHLFTENFSVDSLVDSIRDADNIKADLLLGGVSWVQNVFRYKNNLFWVDNFTGAQFMIIFKRFYKKIIESDLAQYDGVDLRLSSLSNNKFLIYPFISIQKDFGYSDITENNNRPDVVNRLFDDCDAALKHITDGETLYSINPEHENRIRSMTFSDFSIPTCVLFEKEQYDTIENQLQAYSQFDLSFFQVSNNYGSETVALLKKIINTFLEGDDDLFILCGLNHNINKNFDLESFISKVIEVGLRRADLLAIECLSDFDHSLPLSSDVFWVSKFVSSDFLVIYRSFYSKILKHDFQNIYSIFYEICDISSNKMLLLPQFSTDICEASRAYDKFRNIQMSFKRVQC